MLLGSSKRLCSLSFESRSTSSSSALVCCFGKRREHDVVKNPKLIKDISDHNSRPDQLSSSSKHSLGKGTEGGDQKQYEILEFVGRRTVLELFVNGKHLGKSDGQRCNCKRLIKFLIGYFPSSKGSTINLNFLLSLNKGFACILRGTVFVHSNHFSRHMSLSAGRTNLKGPMDKVTSVAIPLALAASSLYMIIFETFLRSEYGGPGTLLVIPFIDMADTLNERELSGGPQAARAAIKWAQDNVEKDWKEWTGTD